MNNGPISMSNPCTSVKL